MKRVREFLLLSALLVVGATSCGDNFKTPLTDATKLQAEIRTGEKFIEPSDGYQALGEVTVCEVVDGDTFNFVNGKNSNGLINPGEISYTLRFEGINTPESTAAVEPWGVKASKFVKSILWDFDKNCQKPYSVVIQNDISVFGQKDNNDRYLGFVWYKMNENSDYRLLNLEIVEHCYSRSYMNSYSDFCPYYDVFAQAEQNGMTSKKRVFGEKDPDFDYTNSTLDVSIKYLRENYQMLGVSDSDTPQGASSGVKLRVTGLIVGFSGGNTFIRDVTDPYENGEYASIYMFTALSVTGMNRTYSIGQVIKFVGKAIKYHGNIQLTDITDIQSSVRDDDKIVVLFNPKDYGISETSDWKVEEKYNAVVSAAQSKGYHFDLFSYDKVSQVDNVTEKKNLEAYLGSFIKIKLTIRTGDSSDPAPTGQETVESHYRKDSDEQDLTILAKNTYGVKLDIRSLYYSKGYIRETNVTVGQTYYVVGQLARYYEGYQLVVPNKGSGSPASFENGSFITPVI